jgi:hypothetical protein
MIGDLILLRFADRRGPHAGAEDPWANFSPPAGLRPLGLPAETAIAADWKLVIEQWLEPPMIDGSHFAAGRDWGLRSYKQLLGSGADMRWQRRLLAPNHLIELRPDGLTVLQVLPSGPGRSLLRKHDFTLCEADRAANAARYLASRLNPTTRPSAIAVVESTQKGIVAFGHEAADGAESSSAATAFRGQLFTLMPMMAGKSLY